MKLIILFLIILVEIIISKKNFTRHKNRFRNKHKLKTNNNDIFCCGLDLKLPKKEVKPVGHYEKMLKHVEEYIWVPGDKPSGLPGAFVVSQDEALGNNKYYQ